MFGFLPYILKCLWRHRVRSLLTVSGTAAALFVFSFVHSVQSGLDRLTRDQLNDQRLIVFQANRFCPSTSKLPQDYAREISQLKGVREAVPIKVFMNNCRASLDVVVFHGMPPESLRTLRSLELTQGTWADYESRQDGAIVGQAVAQRRGIHLGQRFSIGAVTVTVTGIAASSSPADENFIFTHLDFLQRIPGLNSVGTATQIEVLLAEGRDPQAMSTAIDELFKSSQVATNTRPKGVYQRETIGDLVEMISFLHVLAYACVALVLALVGTTTLMSVQDRTCEFAVLQTMGCTPFRIFTIVVVESTVLSLVGGVCGSGAAMLILTFGNLAIGTEGVLVSFLPSVELALMAAGVATGSGVIAGISPAMTVARAEIVSGLKSA